MKIGRMVLHRLFEHPTDGMFGALSVEGRWGCMTLERPWSENLRNVSCIPDGDYTCLKVSSPKFGATWEVSCVPGRGEILFHAGNLVSDSRGCILLGGAMAQMNGKACLIGSRDTMKTFLARLSGFEAMSLQILPVPPPKKLD